MLPFPTCWWRSSFEPRAALASLQCQTRTFLDQWSRPTVPWYPHSRETHNVISGDVSVAGIDAGSSRNETSEAVQNFANLLKAAAQRKLRARSIFDQDSQSGLGQIDALGCSRDSSSGLQETGFTISSTKRSRMLHQEIRAHRDGAFDFTPKSFYRFAEKQLVRRRQINQVVGMNNQGFEIVETAQPHDFVAMRTTEIVRLPLPRTGRENLKRITAQAVSALGRVVHATSTRCMDSDSARSKGRPAFWRRPIQNVPLTSQGARHTESIRRRSGLATRLRMSPPVLTPAVFVRLCADGIQFSPPGCKHDLVRWNSHGDQGVPGCSRALIVERNVVNDISALVGITFYSDSYIGMSLQPFCIGFEGRTVLRTQVRAIKVKVNVSDTLFDLLLLAGHGGARWWKEKQGRRQRRRPGRPVLVLQRASSPSAESEEDRLCDVS